MKTHKHLWDDFISADNFDLAANKALRGKKSKKSAQRFLARRDKKLASLRASLQNGTFKTGRYKVFTVYEPKKRDVYMLPIYPDHIVHHALMNILGPIWQKLFIHDSYACIPGRGLHAASQRCSQMVRKNQFVLQCDIRKFYPSINHDIMMKIIRRKITDKKILCILEDIVRSIQNKPGCGMPIGNLTSQWMGNLYLNDLDMFVKHKMHVKNYIRYCDDFCIFSNDRRELVKFQDILARYLATELGLTFSKCFIKPTSLGLDFIGYRHFKTHTILTKAGAHKVIKKFREIAKKPEISEYTRSQMAAYKGWMKWSCSHNLRRRLCEFILNSTSRDFSKFINQYF